MQIFGDILRSIPRVIGNVLAACCVLVALFWLWFWVDYQWSFRQQEGRQELFTNPGLLILAGSWLLLALGFYLLQRRINRPERNRG